MNGRTRDIREAALAVLERLRANGHVALFAGGCVRDMLLNRPAKDYDVVTDATPERVLALFPRARKVGAKFGVVLVRRLGHDVEVATFRSDGSYSDGRHPDSVVFGTQIEDARRRDFTINGLFHDPTADQVIDHVGGLADLRAGIIRTIGDPDRRFGEDHLRLLRAVRFAARFGFTIESACLDAIRRLAPCLASISAERIRQELEAILTEPTRAVGWRWLVCTGLDGHLAPSWRPQACDPDLVQRRLEALPAEPVSSWLALAAVLAPRTRGEALAICEELRLSNHQARSIAWLLETLPAAYGAAGLEPADLKAMMAHEAWPDLLMLLKADLAASTGDLAAYEELARRAAAVPPDQITPPPLLTGNDLAALGLAPGPAFGRILDQVYRAQRNERISTEEDAKNMALQLLDGAKR